MLNKEIAENLKRLGCCVSEEEPMSAHTSFHIGGAADVFAQADTETALKNSIAFCRQNDIPFFVIGNGSNLLISDDGIAGVVLQYTDATVNVTDTHITVSAGVSVGKLCLTACQYGLSGLEFAFGIPGTVGGGIYMNAGAYGGQLSDVLVSVKVLNEHGMIEHLSVSELNLGYRHSVLMERPLTVLEAEISLTRDDPQAIRARMDDFLGRRRDKQPLEYPSAGSFFKRPTGHFAGALIEQSGLKGYAVGDAQVSEKHAGFVINRGQATCADILALSNHVQATVSEKFGVTLEREVQLLGRV